MNTPYYTNSSQLPVGYTDDLFEALELQDSLQTKYTGGTVMHGFIGERLPSGKEAKKIIKKAFELYTLPYLSISPTFSICPNCGYLNGEVEICDKCQSECLIYSRVVGYLSPTNLWNKGKKEEFKNRKLYKPSKIKTDTD